MIPANRVDSPTRRRVSPDSSRATRAHRSLDSLSQDRPLSPVPARPLGSRAHRSLVSPAPARLPDSAPEPPAARAARAARRAPAPAVLQVRADPEGLVTPALAGPATPVPEGPAAPVVLRRAKAPTRV